MVLWKVVGMGGIGSVSLTFLSNKGGQTRMGRVGQMELVLGVHVPA